MVMNLEMANVVILMSARQEHIPVKIIRDVTIRWDHLFVSGIVIYEYSITNKIIQILDTQIVALDIQLTLTLVNVKIMMNVH